MSCDKGAESPANRRRRLVAAAEEIARDQDGVVSRVQLRRLGLSTAQVRNEVRTRRWREHGDHTVAVHTGPLDQRGRWRADLFEVGADAVLDGVSSLIVAGLTGYDEPVTHASVSKGGHPRHPDGVAVHETRRRTSDDVMGAGVPRTRAAVAALRAALWARSDRQAALVIVMAVQQRLTTGRAVQRELEKGRRDQRRPFLQTIVRDVVDGAQALGELDFAALCRRRGLPPPSRQVLRRGRHGRYYLDVYWDRWGVVVEIEGIHHGAGQTQIADALRQNTLSIQRATVLRVPLLGLRVAADEFMDQVAEALATKRVA
jgi:very-short-patch-repair endonuclease